MTRRKRIKKRTSSEIPADTKRFIGRLRKCSDEAFLNEIKTMAQMKRPKKPSTPSRYYMEHCLKNGTLDKSMERKQSRMLVRKLFSKLPDQERFEYIKKAYEDEEEYLEKVEEYHKYFPDAKLSTKSALSREEQKLYFQLSGKPIKPPCSAWALFFRDAYKYLNEDNSPSDALVRLGKIWKELPACVVARYNYLHKLENYRFFSAMNELLNSLPENEKKRTIKSYRIKYPFDDKLDAYEIAADADEKVKSMTYRELIEISGLEENAITLYTHQALLTNLNMEMTGENLECLTEVAQEQWSSLGTSDREIYLKKAYPMRYLEENPFKKVARSRLVRFLPKCPITGSRKSDLAALQNIISLLPKAKNISPYTVFFSKVASELLPKDSNQRMIKVAELWKQVDDDDRRRYKMEAAIIKERMKTKEEEVESSLSYDEQKLYREYRKNRKKYVRALRLARESRKERPKSSSKKSQATSSSEDSSNSSIEEATDEEDKTTDDTDDDEEDDDDDEM